jgi:RNA polymerase sigma-70 factor (sigma-E family)
VPLWGGSVTLPGPAESTSEDAAGWAPSRSVSDDFAKRFPELYRRAYVVAYRIVGNQNTAQDVAQEALARAYLAWKKVAEHAVPWVVTVSVNLALDQHRTRRRDRRRHAQLVILHEDVRTDPAADHRADLVRALRTLPRRQCQVVVLRYLGDLSELDTAAALGISTGAVKSHASRGLSALRTILQTTDQE